MDKQDSYDKEINSLAEGCPFLGGNPTHCQLYELRKLGYLDKLMHFASLDSDEKKKIIDCHSDCLHQLEAHKLNEVSEESHH